MLQHKDIKVPYIEVYAGTADMTEQPKEVCRDIQAKENTLYTLSTLQQFN